MTGIRASQHMYDNDLQSQHRSRKPSHSLPASNTRVKASPARRLTLRWLHLTDDELLLRLKSLLEREARLNEGYNQPHIGRPQHRRLLRKVWQPSECVPTHWL